MAFVHEAPRGGESRPTAWAPWLDEPLSKDGEFIGQRVGLQCGGPTRTRTWNQGIRMTRPFPAGADYLFTLSVTLVGCGTL